MRILGIIVIILGLAALVLGILFIPQASSAEKEIEESIAPLKINEVDAKYDAVAAKYTQIKTAEEPNIQKGTAAPSDMYNYLSAQRALLGLAKSNIGTAKFVRTCGIINIVAGLGLVLAGLALVMKKSAAA
jgi:uncharacterized membrane protein